MAEFKLNGVGVALVTPFKDDLSPDFESLENVIDHIIEGGCDYIVALGTTAETPTLSIEEKILLTDFIREKTTGRVRLIIGIGGNNTKEVIQDILNRNLNGYSAILSVTPFYNKPTQEGLFQHYKAIADNSPLPIILYNVPGRTGVNLSDKTTLRLADYSEKFIGIKEASGNLEQCKNIAERVRNNFTLISGDDGIIEPLMRIGAKGVISVLANALPWEVKKITSLCNKGKFKEAAELQTELKNLTRLLFEEGNPAGIKAVLSDMGLIKNYLRLPLVRVSQSVEEKLSFEVTKFQKVQIK